MAKPRIFISSTYSDLNETRDAIAKYIRKFDYTPVIFEKDDIPFQPNTLIEDSCYDEIKNCSFLILIIKNKFGAISNTCEINKASECKISSVTQNEYITAIKLGIPVQVFIHKSSMDEYYSYVNQGRNIDFNFHYLESINLANFIDEIFLEKSSRYIYTYIDINDIKNKLRKQWAGLFNKYLENARKYSLRLNEKVKINSFKFFYFRRHKGISQEKLASKTGISINLIKKIEDAGIQKKHIELHDFQSVTLDQITKIANVLQCTVGNIKGGLPDDFLAQYLSYYFKNKGTQQRIGEGGNSKILFKTKAIVFDFDGTLTKSKNNLTTWEEIWLKLGYGLEECAELHKLYSSYNITHQEWCELTEVKFIEKKLSKRILSKLSKEIKLVAGAREVFEELHSNKIPIYICSGSIDYIINKVIGEQSNLFENIKANKFIFNKSNILKDIVGTKYDFEGKANFISQIVKENNIMPYEVLFVGNSLNDEWAHQSGALTLCVNPHMTNALNPIQWNYYIDNLKNMKEILQFVNY